MTSTDDTADETPEPKPSPTLMPPSEEQAQEGTATLVDPPDDTGEAAFTSPPSS